MTYNNYMERREAKLARTVAKRTEWAEKAEQRSNDAYEASNRAVEGIEPGQPILMGHHSQRKHQNALKRSDKAMTRMCEESALAKKHEYKADNAAYALEVRNKPAFCERRIKEALADIRKFEREGRTSEWYYTNAVEKRDYWQARLNEIAPDYANQKSNAEEERIATLQTIADKGGYVFSYIWGWTKLLKVNKKSVKVASKFENGDGFTYSIKYVDRWSETKPA